MKKKRIVSSLVAIAFSASLIAGGTYALFTSESDVNIAVTSGKVDVNATIVKESLQTYSYAWNGETQKYDSVATEVKGTFDNGGTATFDSEAKLALDLMSPGDKATFTIDVDNQSNINVKYRVCLFAEGELAPALVATANIEDKDYVLIGVEDKKTSWNFVEAQDEIKDIQVTVEFPDRADNNDYMEKSAKLTYTVEAVQGNAPTYDPLPPVGVSELTEEQSEVLASEIGTFGGVSGLIKDPTATMNVVVGRSYSIAEAADTIGASQYATWATDFEIYFNNDITYTYNSDDAIVPLKADLFLIGEYGSFGWIPVPLIMPSMANGSTIIKGEPNADGEFTLTLKAGTSVRIMDTFIKTLFSADGFFTYNDIAILVDTFNCGIVLDGTMLGIDDGVPPANTTATLSLNLYETKDGAEVAGGVKQTVHTFSTPIADETVRTAEQLYTAINEGKSTIKIDGMITLDRGLTIGRDMSFIGIDQNSGIDFAGNNIVGNGSAISYKNLYLKTVSLTEAEGGNERSGWYGGIDYTGHSVATYDNCTIEGIFTTYSTTVNATGCTFLPSQEREGEGWKNAYNVFQYGSKVVNLTGCTFYYADRALKIYNENVNSECEMNVIDCTFKAATENFKVDKALVNIDATHLKSVKLTMKNNIVESELASLDMYSVKGESSKVTADVQ